MPIQVVGVASPLHYGCGMKLIVASLLFTAVTTTACKKEEKSTAGDKPGVAAKTDEAPPVSDELAAVLPKRPPAEFTAWDLPARAKAWQGAWVSEAALGVPEAVEIKGAVAKSWNGKVEKTLSFQLESPCSAKFTETLADGSTTGTVSKFTLKNGALVTGLGDAGTRKGKTAVVCVSNQVLTLDESGKCIAWTYMFDKADSEPGTCALATKDGKEVFTAKVNGMDIELAIDGDAIMSEQLAKKSAAKHPDFAAAKAAVPAR